MKKKQRQTLCYTIEREFLNRISISQLLTQIVRSHVKNDMMEKRTAQKRVSENYFDKPYPVICARFISHADGVALYATPSVYKTNLSQITLYSLQKVIFRHIFRKIKPLLLDCKKQLFMIKCQKGQWLNGKWK